MRFEKPCCPECGECADGTFETVTGVALLNFEPDGSAEYGGETKIFWDDQKTDWNKDGTLLICHQGHTWRSQDLDCPVESLPAAADPLSELKSAAEWAIEAMKNMRQGCFQGATERLRKALAAYESRP